MTQRQIAALICKSLGIYCFIGALTSLPLMLVPVVVAMVNDSSGENPMQNATRLGTLINVLPALLSLCAGLFLWLNSDGLARRMVNNVEADAEPIIIGEAAQTIAFSALGVFILSQVLPHIGQLAAKLYLISKQDPLMHREFQGLTLPDTVSIIIQLLMGFWLLLGASGLVRFLQSLRTTGIDKTC